MRLLTEEVPGLVPPENELDPQTHLGLARNHGELWKTVKRPWEAQAFPLRMPSVASVLRCLPRPAPHATDCHSPSSCSRRSMRSSSFQPKRAPQHFSISDRWFSHRALILQRLLTRQPLIHSCVQLIIGKTGEVLSLTQAVHLAIFTLSELNQLSLCVLFLEQRKSAPFEQEARGAEFSFRTDAHPVHP